MSGDAAESLWYSPSAPASAARAALAPLSFLFGAAVRLRAELYERGLADTRKAPAPVVSVGALRVGGAGKTPMVLWLARELTRRGLRPCIVTRGYGGEAAGPCLLDATAAAAPDAARRAGDEAVLLAIRSGVPVAVGADRARVCDTAWRELGRTGAAPDLFLLDDGFQHRRLARDLDIVLVSGAEASERLLPAGPLREPVAALGRAGLVVEMRDAAGGPRDAIVVRPATIVAEARASGLVAAAADRDPAPLSGLDGRRVVAVAGIARPERFEAALRRAGARVVATVLRRDHHRYTHSDLRELDAAASDADLVVTTEKDLVRLGGATLRVPLVALRIDVAFTNAADEERLAGRAASVAAIRAAI